MSATGPRSGRLLIVEDEPADSAMVRALLADAGGPADVACAASLSAAVTSIQAGDISSVLLDLGLPDADGLEALAGILAAQPDLSVIVLTGRDDVDLGVSAISAGAQDYLVKGKVTGELLVRALRYASGRADAVHETAQLAAIVEFSDDAIFSTDFDGTVRTWNRGAEHLYGYSAEEMVGNGIWCVVPVEGRAEVETALQRLAVGGLVDHFETRRVRQDGSEIDVSIAVSPILEHGVPFGASVVARDITSRRRAEAALSDSERSLAEAQRLAKIGSWSADLISGRIQWSDEMFRLLGYAPREFEPTLDHLFSRVHPDDLAVVHTLIETSAEAREPSDIAHRVLLPDGTVTWHAVNVLPTLAADGSVASVHGTVQDVTNDHIANERLRFQASILDAVGEAVVATDLAGTISYWGPGAETLYGWTSAEAVGRPTADVLPTDIAPDQASEILRRLDAGQAWTGILKVRRRDGTFIRAEITNTPVQDEGGRTIAMIGISSDVGLREEATARIERARDQALAASVLKSNFITNVSHEIRTPMNGVLGMTELLLETELDATQIEYAEAARTSAESLLQIINDVLDISKIEAGHLDLESIDFSTTAVIHDVADTFADDAATKGVEIIVSIGDDVPIARRGDPLRLRQILTNLFANAIKFTSTGNVVASCFVVQHDEALPTLRLEIKDTGIGMDADTARRVFEPFEQADSSTTRKYGGTGLGLSITRQLVELMGGECGAESEPGVGSTFWVDLPLSPGLRKGDFLVQTYSHTLAGIPVLVVDDNAVAAGVVAAYLRAADMVVTVAASGEEALALTRERAASGMPYAALVVDMKMPRMNGLELVAALEGDQTTDTTPVVLVTSSAADRARARVGLRGVVADITKPVRRDVLRQQLAELISGVTPDTTFDRSDSRPAEGGLILLAEDNRINQKVVLAMLSRDGHTVDVVSNGVEAATAARTARYDLILMDCQMPLMDGYEATATIRADESAGVRVPIIALTASAMAEDRERCLAAGMDDYLTKPVAKAELAGVVTRWARTGGVRSRR